MNRYRCSPLILLFAAACALGSAVCSAQDSVAAPEPTDLPCGEYHGEIWSDGMYPSVTEFFGETRGGLDGVYRFEYGDDVEEGVLRGCKRRKAQAFRCVWKDRWGSGQLDLEFSEDFSAFSGVWSDTDNPPSLGLRWHGSRRPPSGE